MEYVDMATKRALEAIFFQLGSPLGKGLEKAFQEAINFVNGLDYTGIADGDKQKYRYTKTHRYATATLFPELVKIIKDNTNLVVTKFVDVKKFSGFFAVDMSLDSYSDVTTVLTNQSGTGVEPIPLDEAAQELAEMSTKVDEVNSKILTTVFGKDMKRKIQVIMYMDVDAAFLMNDNLPLGIVESFTAEELTAIYLHEIGHPLTMFAQASNTYLQLERITKQLNVNRGQSMDPKKFVSVYTKEIQPMLNNAVQRKLVNKKVLEASDALYKQAKYYEQTDRSDYLFGTGELLWNLFMRWVLCGLYTWFRAWYAVNIWLTVETILVFCQKPGDKGKVSDVANSPRSLYHIERTADEFAVRHGYGGSLATGLAKLTKMMEVSASLAGSGGVVHSKSLRDSYVFVTYLKFTIGLQAFFRVSPQTVTEDFFDNGAYEKDTARLKRIIQQISTAFKNDMPREMTNQYLSELEAAKNALNDISSTPRKISKCMWTYFLDFPTVLGRLTQSDQPAEMEQMLNEIDDIINNEIYAHAAAFKNLK